MRIGEVVLIVLIVVVAFGSTKLPSLGAGLARTRRGRRVLARRLVPDEGEPWSIAEWALVASVVALGAIALGQLVELAR